MGEKTLWKKAGPPALPMATTTYKKKYCKLVDDYLKKTRDRKRLFHKVRGAKSDSYEEKYAIRLCSKEDFADFIGVSRKTLYNWAEKHIEFAEALEKIHEAQLSRLVNGGLAGIYNSTITKLMLSFNHGVNETQELKEEVHHTFDVKQINRIAERIAARRGSDGNQSGEK